VRGNERAAAALGINVVHVKLYAFSVSAAIAAVGGVFLCLRQPNVQFTDFGVERSVTLVQFAVLGGIGWIVGAFLGGANAPGGLLHFVGSELLSGVDNFANWIVLISAFGLIDLLRRAPDGMAQMMARVLNVPFDRFSRRRRDGVPTAVDRPPRPPARLDVSGVTVKFGAVLALDDVSFSVRPGEIVGLIGPNGAGKTTLLDVVTGFTAPGAGVVSLDGEELNAWSVERRARAGIGRSWQGVELFEEMTVRDNLLAAVDDHSARRYIVDMFRARRPRPTKVLQDVIDEFGLADVLDERPSSLSHGTARQVGIARAIVAEPRVLLLDEPAAGLDSSEGDELAVAIRAVVRSRGIGVLVVEHDVPLLMSLCDRIVVLDFGHKIGEGSPEEMATDAAVVAAYLGTEVSVEKPMAVDSPMESVR